MKGKKVLHSSNSDEWSTPDDFYQELDKIFKFNLDPCSTEDNAKCKRFYTKHDDGLSLAWNGTVFCNPPYSQVDKWCKKACKERANNTKCKRIVLLVPARTDTKWVHSNFSNSSIYLMHKYKTGYDFNDLFDCNKFAFKGRSYIFLLQGRLKFGGAKSSAPFPSMLIVF